MFRPKFFSWGPKNGGPFHFFAKKNPFPCHLVKSPPFVFGLQPPPRGTISPKMKIGLKQGLKGGGPPYVMGETNRGPPRAPSGGRWIPILLSFYISGKTRALPPQGKSEIFWGFPVTFGDDPVKTPFCFPLWGKIMGGAPFWSPPQNAPKSFWGPIDVSKDPKTGQCGGPRAGVMDLFFLKPGEVCF